MDNPPEGMTPEDIRRMSEDALLDMDYFLNEDDLFADEAGVMFLYLLTVSSCSHVQTHRYPTYVQGTYVFFIAPKIVISDKV